MSSFNRSLKVQEILSQVEVLEQYQEIKESTEHSILGSIPGKI